MLERGCGIETLLLILDTYEVIHQHDSWLRRALTHSGERILWVISGREYEQFLLQYRDDFKEELLEEIRINVFAQGDIEEYLKDRLGTDYPVDESGQSELIALVQEISQGVPLAVDGLVGFLKQGMDLDQVYGDIRDQQMKRDEIVKALTLRFLKWCDEDETSDLAEKQLRRLHRHWIEGLALLGRYDRDALAAIAQAVQPENPTDPDALLHELAERYGFIFGNNDGTEMHDLVREILRANLRLAPLSHWLNRFAKATLSYYQQRRQEIEARLTDRVDILTDGAWQETLLSLINAAYWQDRHGRAGTKIWRRHAPELHFFAHDFLEECLTLVAEFKQVDVRFQHELERWRAGGWDQSLAYTTDREVITLWKSVYQQRNQWHNSRLAQVIIAYNYGQIAHAQEDYEAAANTYLALASDQLSPSLKESLAEALSATGWQLVIVNGNAVESKIGVRCAARAVQTKPDDGDIWRTYGVALRESKQFDEAVRAMKKAIVLNPDSDYIRSSLGNVYRDMGQHEQALVAYEKAIELDPEYAHPHYGKGNVYRDMGQHEQALAAYEKAIELDPEYASPHNDMGVLYYSMGEYEQALAAYEKAIDIDPEHAYPHNGMGIVYYYTGQYEQALVAYEKAINLDPEHAYPHNGMGNVYRDMGQHEQALAAYHKAIELDPQDAYPHNSMGIVYYNMGEYEQALVAFYKAIDFDPEFTSPYNNIAEVYLAQGRFEEARTYLDKFFELYPEGIVESHIMLGVLEYRDGNIVVARQQFEQGLVLWQKEWAKQGQSKAGLLDEKAIALLCLGKRKEALSTLQDAIDVMIPGDVFSYPLYEMLAEAPEPPDGLDDMVALLKQAEAGRNP